MYPSYNDLYHVILCFMVVNYLNFINRRIQNHEEYEQLLKSWIAQLKIAKTENLRKEKLFLLNRRI
jgi:hypothetical protein